MFVIMGTKEKNKEIGHGQFFCPTCKTTRHYVQYESAPYFSLYFIPLFKLGSAKNYIQCQVCHNIFSSDLLSQNTRKLALLALITELQKEAISGTPSHVLYHKLLSKNVDGAVAKAISLAILGNYPKVCRTCAALFHERVTICTNCGGELVENRDAALLEQKEAADRLLENMRI